MTMRFTIDNPQQLADVVSAIGTEKFPMRVDLRQVRERDDNRFKRMNALIRDIARHELGRMSISEKEHERVVDRWKRTDVWPKETDPTPDYHTGEVLYLPLSRADLDDDQLKGICQWLDHYIDNHGVVRHDPQTRERSGMAA